MVDSKKLDQCSAASVGWKPLAELTLPTAPSEDGTVSAIEVKPYASDGSFLTLLPEATKLYFCNNVNHGGGIKYFEGNKVQIADAFAPVLKDAATFEDEPKDYLAFAVKVQTFLKNPPPRATKDYDRGAWLMVGRGIKAKTIAQVRAVLNDTDNTLFQEYRRGTYLITADEQKRGEVGDTLLAAANILDESGSKIDADALRTVAYTVSPSRMTQDMKQHGLFYNWTKEDWIGAIGGGVGVGYFIFGILAPLGQMSLGYVIKKIKGKGKDDNDHRGPPGAAGGGLNMGHVIQAVASAYATGVAAGQKPPEVAPEEAPAPADDSASVQAFWTTPAFGAYTMARAAGAVMAEAADDVADGLTTVANSQAAQTAAKTVVIGGMLVATAFAIVKMPVTGDSVTPQRNLQLLGRALGFN